MGQALIPILQPVAALRIASLRVLAIRCAGEASGFRVMMVSDAGRAALSTNPAPIPAHSGTDRNWSANNTFGHWSLKFAALQQK